MRAKAPVRQLPKLRIDVRDFGESSCRLPHSGRAALASTQHGFSKRGYVRSSFLLHLRPSSAQSIGDVRRDADDTKSMGCNIGAKQKASNIAFN
jgi:hypothetical protein